MPGGSDATPYGTSKAALNSIVMREGSPCGDWLAYFLLRYTCVCDMHITNVMDDDFTSIERKKAEQYY